MHDWSLCFQSTWRGILAQRFDKPPPAKGGLLTRISFLLGSAGLLVAMSADAIAVLGRNVGFTFLGAIEIVQASVVLAASAAMPSACRDACARRVTCCCAPTLQAR